jgi:transglutaminase-like putative cysteine protease
MINDKPIEGVQTDTRSHPAGAKGAHLSLKEVAERAWKARMSPRLRAWVTQVLDKAGVSNGSRRAKGQAVLDAYRKKVPYVADPLMGEFMATPDQTLCLDEGGLCIIGGDCDDASVVLAGSMMCIGIPAMIVGSSHKAPYDVPTHVFMAFQDELDDWVRMDGTTKYPAGQIAPHTREWWVEPGEKQKEDGVGDFVGMSGGDLGSSGDRFDLIYPMLRK